MPLEDFRRIKTCLATQKRMNGKRKKKRKRSGKNNGEEKRKEEKERKINKLAGLFLLPPLFYFLQMHAAVRCCLNW